MAEVRALKIGLVTQLASGAKVFGVLSDDGACTCFELTAPDGLETSFALSDDALAAMVDISVKLRERNADGVTVAPATDWLDEAMKLAEDYARAWQHDADGNYVIKDQAPKAKDKLRAHLALGVDSVDGSRDA